ncbi:MAG: hypothetical protein IJ766_10535 [Clostridia bacterium]|nr:hypothetical protein [Clostridia bacterium]
MFADCENCWYNTLDEEAEEYFCALNLDEDEFFRMLENKSGRCRYFRPFSGEYEIVRKQN